MIFVRLRTLSIRAYLLAVAFVVFHFSVAHAEERRVVVVEFDGGTPARALQTKVQAVLEANNLAIVSGDAKIGFDTAPEGLKAIAQASGARGVVTGSLARKGRAYSLTVAVSVDDTRSTTTLALGVRPVLTKPLEAKLEKQLTPLLAPLLEADEDFMLAGDPRATGANGKATPGANGKAPTGANGKAPTGTPAKPSTTPPTTAPATPAAPAVTPTPVVVSPATGTTVRRTNNKGPMKAGDDPTDVALSSLPPWVQGLERNNDVLTLRVRVPQSSQGVAHVLALQMSPETADALLKALRVARAAAGTPTPTGDVSADGLPSWVQGVTYRDSNGLVVLRARVPRSALTAAYVLALEMTNEDAGALVRELESILGPASLVPDAPVLESEPEFDGKLVKKTKKQPFRNFAFLRAPNPSNRVYIRGYWDSRDHTGLEGLVRVTTPGYFTIVNRITIRRHNSSMPANGAKNPEMFQFTSIYGPAFYSFGPVIHIGNPLGTGGDALRLGVSNTLLLKFTRTTNLFFLTLFLPYDFTRPSKMFLSSMTLTAGPARAELVTAYVWPTLSIDQIESQPKPTYLRPYFGVSFWRDWGLYVQYEYNQGDMTPSFRKGLRFGFEMQAKF